MRVISRSRAALAALVAVFAVSVGAAGGGVAAANASPALCAGSTHAGAAALPDASALIGTPPTAVLQVSPATGVAPLTVTADASASTPGTNLIGTYTFAWGDGTADTGPQAGATATHTYTTAGPYTVTVTVTDILGPLLGTSATATAPVTVVTVPIGPAAALSVTPASGPAPLAVTASGASSTAGTFPIASYTFVWGDGASSGPSAAASQPHTYTVPGQYNVVLTVADNQMPAHTATAQFTVNVGSGVAPNPSLILTPPSGPSPLMVTANAAGSTPGSSPISTYAFDFGDGTIVGPQQANSAQHTYQSQGTYPVKLTVVDRAGLSATTTTSEAVGPPPGTVVHRVAGADRYATGVAVSGARWDATTDTAPSARHPHSVVLARGDQFADALAGIPLAAKGNGPLLLSHSDALQDYVDAEIRRILPTGATVYLLGGTAALSQAVEDRLKVEGYQTTRLWGADRYETALAVAKNGLGDPQRILVATGTDFPDALAAGPFAANGFAQNGQPAAVILSDGARLPPSVAAYVKSKAAGSTNAAPHIVGIGGPGSYAIAANLPTSQFDALVGADRFDTAAKLAPYFPATAGFGVADGDNFPDALTGGALQALDGGPVLLVEPDYLPQPTAQMLATVQGKPSMVTVFGGTVAVSDATVGGIANSVGGRIG